MPVAKRTVQSYLRMAAKGLVGAVYGVVFRKRSMTNARNMPPPLRILLLNGAHIGDVVIATSIIPILRSAYPSAELGMLTGSWSHIVVSNHPELTYTHCVDHWRLNRANITIYGKLLRYIKTRRTALKELKQVRYDVAISTFGHFPDFLDLAWTARIPVRIGYEKSIFSSLATDLVEDKENPFIHQSARVAELLGALPVIHLTCFGGNRFSLPVSLPRLRRFVRCLVCRTLKL